LRIGYRLWAVFVHEGYASALVREAESPPAAFLALHLRWRRDVDGNRGAGVLSTIGAATVVLERDAHRCAAESVRRRLVGESAVRSDGRLSREQVVVVVGHFEAQCLAVLVVSSLGDVCSPRDTLRACVHVDRLVAALGEARRVVDRGDVDGNRGRGRPTIAIRDGVVEAISAVEVLSWRVFGAAAVDPGAPVGGWGHAAHRQGIAVGIGVVRKHIDRYGVILVSGRAVGIGHRGAVGVEVDRVVGAGRCGVAIQSKVLGRVGRDGGDDRAVASTKSVPWSRDAAKEVGATSAYAGVARALRSERGPGVYAQGSRPVNGGADPGSNPPLKCGGILYPAWPRSKRSWARAADRHLSVHRVL
jgi:hypothetical protein